jgi:hypothetical protein
MRKKIVAVLLVLISAVVLASPALAGHGKSGSTIIARQ